MAHFNVYEACELHRTIFSTFLNTLLPTSTGLLNLAVVIDFPNSKV